MVDVYSPKLRVPSLLDRISHRVRNPGFRLDSGLRDGPVALALRDRLAPFSFQESDATLFYPGCGLDVAFPLLILDILADDAKRWSIVTIDDSTASRSLIAGIQRFTGTVDFRMDGEDVIFRWRDKSIRLVHRVGDALSLGSDGCDIFLTRGFDIIHSKDPSFIGRVASKTSRLIITDMAFRSPVGFERLPIPLPDWGFYKSPAVYVRRKD